MSRKIRAALCGLASLIVVAGGCRIDPDAFSDVDVSTGQIRYFFSGDDSSLEVSARGELKFKEDDSDLASISEDGEFWIEETRGAETRRLELRGGSGGSIERHFFVNGKPRGFDSDARSWLQETLPRVLRETGYDAAGRVQRLISHRGVAGVIEEISRIENGASKTAYVEQLILSAPDLDPAAIARILEESETIGSSTQLNRVISLLAGKSREDRNLTVSLVRASQRIQSSSQRRDALERICLERELDDEAAVASAKSAEEISSSSEKASALVMLAKHSPRSSAATLALLEAASTIRSGSEASRALREIISRPGLPPDAFIRAADVIAQIRSSSEKASALQQLAESLDESDSRVVDAFLSATASVDSTSQRERTLLVFLARRDLSLKTLEKTGDFVRSHMPEGGMRDRLAERIRLRLKEGR